MVKSWYGCMVSRSYVHIPKSDVLAALGQAVHMLAGGVVRRKTSSLGGREGRSYRMVEVRRGRVEIGDSPIWGHSASLAWVADLPRVGESSAVSAHAPDGDGGVPF
jgi:hypothetical protein